MHCLARMGPASINSAANTMTDTPAGTLLFELADVITGLTRRQQELLESLKSFRVELLDAETPVDVYVPPAPRLLLPPPPRMAPTAPSQGIGSPPSAPTSSAPPRGGCRALPHSLRLSPSLPSSRLGSGCPLPKRSIRPGTWWHPPTPGARRAQPTRPIEGDGRPHCIRSGTMTTSRNSTTCSPGCRSSPRFRSRVRSPTSSAGRGRHRWRSRRSRDFHDPHTSGRRHHLEFLAPTTCLRCDRLT